MHMHGTNTTQQDADNIVDAHNKIEGRRLEKVIQFPSDSVNMLIEVLPDLVSGEMGKEPEVYDMAKEYGDIGNRTDGIQHPTKLILLSTEEWDWVRQGKMPLPKGWELSQAVVKFTTKH